MLKTIFRSLHTKDGFQNRTLLTGFIMLGKVERAELTGL